MADNLKPIGAKIVLDGEASFRSALKACNAELRNSRSELSLVEAKYKGNANSLEALEAKEKALSKCYVDQQNKLNALNNIITKATENQERFKNKADQASQELKEAEAQLEELKNTSGDTTEEQEKLKKKIDELTEKQRSNTDAYNKATSSVSKYQAQANDVQTEIYKLDNAIKENTQCLNEAKNSADGCANSIDGYGKKVKGAGRNSQEWGEQTANAANAIATVIAASGIKQGIDEITDVIKDSTDAAIEFESAIAGVYKTVDGTDEQLQAISDGILEMSYRIPSTTTEIAGVAESAGQLGIATEDVLDFTEVMIGLGEATNLTSDEAASSLAKFANITKMSADNYSNLGSVIVNLGNKFATTEADIVAMATKMASAGTMAGMSQPQILALAAALSSVGNEAEAGGSTMSKLLTEISLSVETSSDSLQMFAEVANMSADEFSQAWRNDAAGALTAFISGLNDTTRLGKSTVAMLDDLGIKEIRLSNATRSLANYSDGLTSAFETAESAWTKNIALQTEVSKRYATTESKMQMLKNSANGLKIAVGNALLPTMNNLAETGGDILETATEFVEENPQVVKGIVAVTVAATAFVGTVTALTVAIQLYNSVTAVASGGTTLFAGAVVSVAAALATLIVTNLDAADSFEDLTESTQNAKQAFDDASDTYSTTIADLESASVAASTYIDKLAALEQQGISTDAQQAEYNLLIESLKSLMPDLNIEIDEQTGLIKGGTAALKENADAWAENAKRQAAATALADEYQALIEAQLALSKSGAQYRELIDNSTAATKKVESAYKAIANAIGISTDELDEHIAADSEYLEYIKAEYPDVVQQYDDAKEAAHDLSEDVKKLGEAHNENASIVVDMEESYADAEEAIKDYVGATDEAVDANGDLADSQDDCTARISNTVGEVGQLCDAYDEAYNDAKEKIEGQVDIFDKLAEKSNMSVDTIKENMDSNTEFMEKFIDAYKRASEIEGIDPTFLQQFEDINPDNLAILNSLLASTPDEVAEVMKSWEGFNETKDTLAGTLADVETNFSSSMNQIVINARIWDERMKTEADKTGKNFGQGFVDGINGKLSSISAAGSKAGQVALQALREALDEHSPSRETALSADYFADGFIIELEKRQKDMEQAVLESAYLMTAAMNTWQPQSFNVPQTTPVIDTVAITEAVRRGLQEANVTVDFDYRGYDKGRSKYDR